jgi:hypothetical protein
MKRISTRDFNKSPMSFELNLPKDPLLFANIANIAKNPN